MQGACTKVFWIQCNRGKAHDVFCKSGPHDILHCACGIFLQISPDVAIGDHAAEFARSIQKPHNSKTFVGDFSNNVKDGSGLIQQWQLTVLEHEF